MSLPLVLRLPTSRVDRGSEFTSAAAIGEMARRAEQLGYRAVSVTDHPFPGVDWLRGGGHHSLDPFVALAVAAGATTTLRLQFSLLVLPYRNPYVTAKAVVSLDAVSAGRVVVGVGAGYAASEFAALSADFENRNAVTDRSLAAMQDAWRPAAVIVPGGDPDGHEMLPHPARPIPVLVGGNSRRAMVRAVRLGDGWMPMFNPPELASRRRSAAIGSPETLARAVGELATMAAEAGRARPIVSFNTGPRALYSLADEPARAREYVATLAEAGADELSVDVPGESLREWLVAAERLALAVRQTG